MENSIAGPSGPSGSRSGSPGPPATSVKSEGFTILYSGEGNILADVVFVHGLRGHPEKTWTKELSSHPDNSRKLSTLWAGMVKRRKVDKQTNIDVGRNVFWPRDLLPGKVPDIRILTYGYDLNVVNGKNKNGIYQHAENMLSALQRIRLDLVKDSEARKIIFVAHSLGGVIVKEVLRQSSNHTYQPHLLAIFQDTYGLIFLGCPHRGSSAAEWGVIAGNIARLGGLSPNTDLLRSLGTDSQALSLLSLDFSRFMRDRSFKVHSFREEQGMTGIAGIIGKVVEDASSIIGDAEEGKEGINANHRDMGRFGSMEDEGFLKVAGVICRYVKDLWSIQNSLNHVARQELKRLCTRNIGDLSEGEIKCLQSFANADYSSYRRRVAVRHPGTLNWVLEHEVYQEWVSPDTRSSLLWISGSPGCGKTVMSAFLLDCLEEKVKGTDINLAYFFCDDKEQSQKSAQSMLSGVIHQLITTTPYMIKHAMGTHQAHGPKMLESLDLLWNIFISVVTDPLCEGAYIVLDALDECEKGSRDDLLRRFNNYFLSEASKTAQSYLKVLVTSRPYHEIKLLLSKRRTIRLKTEDEGQNIKADITSFISHNVDELARVCSYDTVLMEAVQAKLETGADGMFLWVSLIVQELFETPLDQVSEALEAIPSTVTGVYTHLLKRLTGKKVKMVSNILTWVVMAPEPMTVTELAIACSVKITHTAESSIERSLIAGFEHNIALCGPILKVQDGVVYLVHQSAKDFLLHLGVGDCLEHFRIIPALVCLELAITCLTYLSFNDWDVLPEYHMADPITSFNNLERISQLPSGRKHDFHRFAAKSRPQFVRQTNEGDPNLWGAFCRLSESGKRLQLAFKRGTDIDSNCSSLLPLFISCYYGLFSISLSLLDSGADVHAHGTRNDYALQAASSNGHEQVVLLLLDRGADVNAEGGWDGNALQLASSNGHERVVLLLLNRGADVNAQGGEYGNALQVASYNGDEKVVLLLLDRGADVNAQGGYYGTALQAASFDGNEKVVLLLLNRGADVNAQGGYYGNALQAASFNRQEQVVLLLLDRGADVNAQGGYYGTALQAASHNSHNQVVLLLLNRGADINAQGGYYGTALKAAKDRSRTAIVDLLLQYGVTPTSQCLITAIDEFV
ncbi:hypothetical protein Q9L58_008518 [Maublancomyces gigas]|uniref:Nephrocystin 3-like N-terminal domain-containing protein n=1 Tax=Discina gigas TaxID=1032678 RepID=A0ABR3G9G4_9PEZI